MKVSQLIRKSDQLVAERGSCREAPMEQFDYDIVQIGYGPVGQVFAALAGRSGCRVGVYERYPALYGLPRAGHIDHEIMRVFQSLGCADAVERSAIRSNTYEWRNAAGQTLIDFQWNAEGISGWPSDYLVFQPDLEDALHDVVTSTKTVSLHLGVEAIEIAQFPDHVELTVRDGSSQRGVRTVTARYLVAADGGSSFARKALNLDWDDLGFSQPWLVVDFKERRALSLPFENGQICDPERPMCLFQIGKHHRRFSFMVKPGEEEWARETETAWSLVSPWVGPDDVDLIRQTTYVFESKLLPEWRMGRAFFIGDSAHVMPPFMGQGMCSGIRDAANLSWKIAAVLSGKSADSLLDSYCTERKPHVADLIRLSIEVGRISCTTDPEAARKRDQTLLGGARPPEPVFPGLVSGVRMSAPNAVEAALVGRLGPQAAIRIEGRTMWADDIFGSGWHLICSHDVSSSLSAKSCEILKRIKATTMDFSGDKVEDITGFYADFFAKHGVSAILVRPDFYIYSAAETLSRVNAAIEELEHLLALADDKASPHSQSATAA
jgi:2-polyprenyl-6-methoxyphenol hydroxylase-like FAD-dependent oxidoreductase